MERGGRARVTNAYVRTLIASHHAEIRTSSFQANKLIFKTDTLYIRIFHIPLSKRPPWPHHPPASSSHLHPPSRCRGLASHEGRPDSIGTSANLVDSTSAAALT